MDSWRGTKIKPIGIQNYELASEDRLTEILKWLAQKIRLVVIILLLYLSLPAVLSLFPPNQRNHQKIS